MAEWILVIDDEASVRDAFQLALESAGYRVETAADGEEGLEKACAHPPQLVFLDLKMPGLDGVEVLRQLQTRFPYLPVYIVTAFRREFLTRLKQASREGLHFQVADKPLDLNQIRQIAQGILKGGTVVE